MSKYVIANSIAGLKSNGIKRNERSFVLYNGIESSFKNTLNKDKILQKRIKLIPNYADKPGEIFISVANMIPYKDFYTVFSALSKYRDFYWFYYFIVGDGPMRNQIETMIREFKLERNVFITGRIENVRDYLFISDIMIHSSYGEGISNAILEGMYAGLPIIATNVGGIPETVYPGSSMLFPYKDDKALLDCLLKAPTVFESFDPNSENYKNHLAKFSVENMIKRFEEIIKEITK